jgi:dolichol-phosphate mannosyltransferase
MRGEPEFSIVIPAYLEEENLRILLPRLVDAMRSLERGFEIIVVDTVESMDDTKALCAAVGAICLNREGGNDYADAIRTGIRRAKGEYVIFMDADGSHSPEFIPKLAARRGDNDVVIASRYVEGGSTDNRPLLVLMSHIVNLLYSAILGLNCKDVSNSFKLYRADQLKALSLTCKNFDVVEEILYKLKKRNPDLRIVEIPFCFKERMFGHTKRNLFLFILSYVGTIIRLRFGK